MELENGVEANLSTPTSFTRLYDAKVLITLSDINLNQQGHGAKTRGDALISLPSPPVASASSLLVLGVSSAACRMSKIFMSLASRITGG